MEKKNVVFHGTTKEFVKNILKEGLKPSSGVYGTFVYTTKSPYKSLEKSGGNSIVIINPKGMEDFAYIPKKKNGREKDWMLFEKNIPPEKIMGVIEIYENRIKYIGRDGGEETIEYKSDKEIKRIIGEISRKINDAIYNPIEYEKIKRRIVP